nr:hypothetical protein [uncultured Flavobacterium sp.]
MENYFVLLELPDTAYENTITKPGTNFWQSARQAVMNGRAKIISSRVDTGVCEELKSYLKHINHYTTFVLLQTALCPTDFINNSSLFSVLASSIEIGGGTQVLDQDNNFRVIAQA